MRRPIMHGTSKGFWRKLAKIRKNQMLNGNGAAPVKPKYIEVALLKGLTCLHCKQALTMTDKIICRTPEELCQRAEKEHLGAPKTCAKPRLLITFGNALVNAELLADLADDSIII